MNRIALVMLIAILGSIAVGCSALKAGPTLPPPPITAENEVAVQIFSSKTDDGTVELMILAWPGWNFEQEVPQAKFSRYLTLTMQKNGCSNVQPLILAPGKGVAFYGATSDYGNLPSDNTQNLVYWRYCGDENNFSIPVIVSYKTGEQRPVSSMTPAYTY